jgi:CBS domain-containing protein
MQVQQVMTRVVHTCGPNDTLNKAAQLMWEHDCGCVPVIDHEAKVVGLITDRDIAMASYTQGKLLEHIGISTVMSRDVRSCKATDRVSLAEERMRDHQVRRLPVTDAEGKIVGLIALNDIVLEAERERGAKRPEISTEEVAVTIAAVCRHRGTEALVASA